MSQLSRPPAPVPAAQITVQSFPASQAIGCVPPTEQSGSCTVPQSELTVPPLTELSPPDDLPAWGAVLDAVSDRCTAAYEDTGNRPFTTADATVPGQS